MSDKCRAQGLQMQSERADQPTALSRQVLLKIYIIPYYPEAFNFVNVSGGFGLFNSGNSQMFARLD